MWCITSGVSLMLLLSYIRLSDCIPAPERGLQFGPGRLQVSEHFARAGHGNIVRIPENLFADLAPVEDEQEDDVRASTEPAVRKVETTASTSTTTATTTTTATVESSTSTITTTVTSTQTEEAVVFEDAKVEDAGESPSPVKEGDYEAVDDLQDRLDKLFHAFDGGVVEFHHQNTTNNPLDNLKDFATLNNTEFDDYYLTGENNIEGNQFSYYDQIAVESESEHQTAIPKVLPGVKVLPTSESSAETLPSTKTNNLQVGNSKNPPTVEFSEDDDFVATTIAPKEAEANGEIDENQSFSEPEVEEETIEIVDETAKSQTDDESEDDIKFDDNMQASEPQNDDGEGSEAGMATTMPSMMAGGQVHEHLFHHHVHEIEVEADGQQRLEEIAPVEDLSLNPSSSLATLIESEVSMTPATLLIEEVTNLKDVGPTDLSGSGKRGTLVIEEVYHHDEDEAGHAEVAPGAEEHVAPASIEDHEQSAAVEDQKSDTPLVSAGSNDDYHQYFSSETEVDDSVQADEASEDIETASEDYEYFYAGSETGGSDYRYHDPEEYVYLDHSTGAGSGRLEHEELAHHHLHHFDHGAHVGANDLYSIEESQDDGLPPPTVHVQEADSSPKEIDFEAGRNSEDTLPGNLYQVVTSSFESGNEATYGEKSATANSENQEPGHSEFPIHHFVDYRPEAEEENKEIVHNEIARILFPGSIPSNKTKDGLLYDESGELGANPEPIVGGPPGHNPHIDLEHPLISLIHIEPHSLQLLVKPKVFEPETYIRLLYERVGRNKPAQMRHLDDPVIETFRLEAPTQQYSITDLPKGKYIVCAEATKNGEVVQTNCFETIVDRLDSNMLQPGVVAVIAVAIIIVVASVIYATYYRIRVHRQKKRSLNKPAEKSVDSEVGPVSLVPSKQNSQQKLVITDTYLVPTEPFEERCIM